MDNFEKLLNQMNNPDFETNGKIKLLSCSKDLINSNIDYKNKKNIINKMLYLFPNDVFFYYKMGCILINKNVIKSLMWHKLAYSIKPDYFENLLALCRILYNMKMYREIIRLNVNQLFDKFIYNQPEFMHYYYYSLKTNLHAKDLIKCSLHRVKECSQIKCQTIQQMESKFDNYVHLSANYFFLADIDSSMKHAKKAYELAVKFNLKNDILKIYQSYLCLYNHIFCDNNIFFEEAVKINNHLIVNENEKYKFNNNKSNSNKKIRIGYISSDFNEHAVSYFILPILKNFNTTKFEIFLYINLNEIHGFYKNLNVNFRLILNKPDSEVANNIFKDKIDILFDLNGNTANNRLKVFSYNPAPVKITYIGHPNTTGSYTLDYRFVDNITDPSNSLQKYSEKLIRLPNCFLIYEELYNFSSFIPKYTNEKQIVFGALNKESKNSIFIMNIWSKLLNEIKNSKIIIKLESFDNEEERLQYYIKHLKIEKERITVLTKLSDQAYFKVFTDVDILLDTSPYSGTTTTCHALYNSLPVITLYNKDYHSHNVSASILINSGLNELVANSEDEYIDIAKRLCSNKNIIDDYKKTIKPKFLKLMDAKKFMIDYENTILDIYDEHFNDK